MGPSRNSSEVIVTTSLPHRKIFPLPPHLIGATLVLDYRIRVPRGASLFVEHDGREVNVENLTGDVQVTTPTGPVRVPGDSSY